MNIFLDGQWLTPDKAKTPIYEPGFLYAQGLFETMRADNKKIFRLDKHIIRLMRSLPTVKIKLNYSKQRLEDIINKTVSFNNYSPCYVRLTVWQGDKNIHVSVITKKYSPYSQEKYISGFKAILSSLRQNETSMLSNIKSSSRLHFLLAEQEAKAKGVDEALLLNSKGKLSEGTRTNIFLVKDKMLFTPDKDSGCLLGITREAILDIAIEEKIKTYEKVLTAEELFDCDEAFLTNSLIGVMPLTLIDDKKIGQGSMGKLTSIFFKKYWGSAQKG